MRNLFIFACLVSLTACSASQTQKVATGGSAGTETAGGASGSGTHDQGGTGTEIGGSSGTATGGTSNRVGTGIGGASVVFCDPAHAFGTPRPVTELNTPDVIDGAARLTADELTVVFYSLRSGAAQIYQADRQSPTEVFGTPRAIVDQAVNVPNQYHPWVSDDGLTLAFTNGVDILWSTRTGRDQLFASVTTITRGQSPFVIGGKNGTLYYLDAPTYQSVGTIMQIPLINWAVNGTPSTQVTGRRPVPSRDELTLYYGGGATNVSDIWTAQRISRAEPFVAVGATQFATPNYDLPDWISLDGCRLYLDQDPCTTCTGTNVLDIFVAEREP